MSWVRASFRMNPFPGRNRTYVRNSALRSHPCRVRHARLVPGAPRFGFPPDPCRPVTGHFRRQPGNAAGLLEHRQGTVRPGIRRGMGQQGRHPALGRCALGIPRSQGLLAPQPALHEVLRPGVARLSDVATACCNIAVGAQRRPARQTGPGGEPSLVRGTGFGRGLVPQRPGIADRQQGPRSLRQGRHQLQGHLAPARFGSCRAGLQGPLCLRLCGDDRKTR